MISLVNMQASAVVVVVVLIPILNTCSREPEVDIVAQPSNEASHTVCALLILLLCLLLGSYSFVRSFVRSLSLSLSYLISLARSQVTEQH